jgi:hypothetical protein
MLGEEMSVPHFLTLNLRAGIRTFIQDLDATKLSAIDAEFEKVADQAPPQPTKISVRNVGSYLRPSQFRYHYSRFRDLDKHP